MAEKIALIPSGARKEEPKRQPPKEGPKLAPNRTENYGLCKQKLTPDQRRKKKRLLQRTK